MPHDQGITLPPFASLRLGDFALNSSSSIPIFRPHGLDFQASWLHSSKEFTLRSEDLNGLKPILRTFY